MDMNVNKLQEMVEDRRAWCVAVYGVTKSRTGLSNSHFHTLGEEAEPRYFAIRGSWGDRKTSQKEMSSQGAQDDPGGISTPSL